MDKMKIKKRHVTTSHQMITRKEQFKDLGIIMNEKADFTDHINSVCSIH